MDATEPRPHQFVVRGKVGLGVAVETDATGAEPLKVHDRGDHALAAKPVQRPEQHAIKPALMGVLKEPGELLALLDALPTALTVDVLVDQLAAESGRAVLRPCSEAHATLFQPAHVVVGLNLFARFRD